MNKLTGIETIDMPIDVGEYNVSVGFLDHKQEPIEKAWLTDEQHRKIMKTVRLILIAGDLRTGDRFDDGEVVSIVSERWWTIKDEKPLLQIWVQ